MSRKSDFDSGRTEKTSFCQKKPKKTSDTDWKINPSLRLQSQLPPPQKKVWTESETNKSTCSAALFKRSALTSSVKQDNNRNSTKPWRGSYIRLLYCKRFAPGKGTVTSDLAMTQTQCDAKTRACYSTMLKKKKKVCSHEAQSWGEGKKISLWVCCAAVQWR